MENLSFPVIARRLAFALCALSGGPVIAGPGNEYPFETYVQEVVLEFHDEASAKEATVSLSPLFDGAHRAVSCRWDDNVTSANEETRSLMEKYGIRGTFYLNSRYFSPMNTEVDYLETAKKLIPGGNSIGGHSMTHPFITYFHPNRMFEEMAAVRVEWEANLDAPLTSYAYSFIDFLPGPRGKEAQAETIRTLERAGYYHTAENIGLMADLEPGIEISPIMPPENQSDDEFKRGVEWAYSDKQVIPDYPMISNSMHAWYGTPLLDKGFDALEWRFKLLAGLENVWHCNQNEYGAYRRQIRSSTLSKPVREGRIVKVRVERPHLIELGNTTPMTLEIGGVDSRSITGVTCQGARVQPSRKTLENRSLFHLHHSRGQSLPVKIGRIDNLKNRREVRESDVDADFPGVLGLLSGTMEQLELSVSSKTGLHDIQITWRMPMGWSQGVVREQLGDLAAVAEQTWKLPITLDKSGRPYAGQPYFIAQMDFLRAGKPGRIHFTCHLPEAGVDEYWPRDGFSLLGPFGEGEFDEKAFEAAVVSEGTPSSWRTRSGETVKWRANARDGYIHQDWLDPEYVRTMGTWDPKSPAYVLRSRVMSPDEREFELFAQEDQIAAVYINGTKAERFRSKLKRGTNELVIVYRPQTLNQSYRRLAACFVRLCKSGTKERMSDLIFKP